MELLQIKHEMKRRAHPTVNTNIANMLSKIQGGEVGEKGSAEQQNKRQKRDKRRAGRT